MDIRECGAGRGPIFIWTNPCSTIQRPAGNYEPHAHARWYAQITPTAVTRTKRFDVGWYLVRDIIIDVLLSCSSFP